MKDIMRLFAQLMASMTLMIAVVGVVNIIFDWDLAFGKGANPSPFPKDPVELALLVTCLMIVAGLFWLAGSLGDIFNAARRKPFHAFGILVVLTAALVIGGNYGFTLIMGGPLQRAVEMGNTQKVEELTVRNSYEPAELVKPLYFALQQSDYVMAEAIMAAGADVNHVRDTEFESTLLHASVSYFDTDAIDFLLQQGADPNAQDNLGRTPMLTAVTYRDSQFPDEDPVLVVKMLHEAGGDPTIAADNGDTISAIAERDNNAPVLDYLAKLQTPDTSVSNKVLDTPSAIH